MKNKLDLLYDKYINKERIDITSETVDFIGINYAINTNNYTFKTYYFPNSCINSSPKTSNSIISYTTNNKMNRFYWQVRDSLVIREYISLFNRTNINICNLINFMAQRYTFINENLSEINELSKMNITNNTNYNYSSLYIIGFKESFNEEDSEVVGIEWLTRKCPDPDDIGYEYFYDDKYFANYLKKLNIKAFLFILDKLSVFINNDLHFWVFAIDYSKKKKKYKIYLKGQSCKSLMPGNEILKNLFPDIYANIIAELDQFYIIHKELYLYGFALCIDTNENWSVNFYFKLNKL